MCLITGKAIESFLSESLDSVGASIPVGEGWIWPFPSQREVQEDDKEYFKI